MNADVFVVHTSEGNAAVNVLNSFNWSPIAILSSWFSSTDSSACVPHAFGIVCAAKKRFSDASGSYEPSGGSSPPLVPDSHLNRKMTP